MTDTHVYLGLSDKAEIPTKLTVGVDIQRGAGVCVYVLVCGAGGVVW